MPSLKVLLNVSDALGCAINHHLINKIELILVIYTVIRHYLAIKDSRFYFGDYFRH